MKITQNVYGSTKVIVYALMLVLTRVQAQTVTIPTSGLNPNSRHDMQRLYDQMLRAAEAVCPGYTSLEEPVYARAKLCVDTAMREAVNKANNKILFSLEWNRQVRQLH